MSLLPPGRVRRTRTVASTGIPAVSPSRRRLTAVVTAIVAALLAVLLWPVGLLVAGLFGICAAVSCRHWSRAARVTVLPGGTCLALGSAIVLGDYSDGTTLVRVR